MPEPQEALSMEERKKREDALKRVLAIPGAKLVVAPDVLQWVRDTYDRIPSAEGPNDTALRAASGIPILVSQYLYPGSMIPIHPQLTAPFVDHSHA